MSSRRKSVSSVLFSWTTLVRQLHKRFSSIRTVTTVLIATLRVLYRCRGVWNCSFCYFAAVTARCHRVETPTICTGLRVIHAIRSRCPNRPSSFSSEIGSINWTLDLIPQSSVFFTRSTQWRLFCVEVFAIEQCSMNPEITLQRLLAPVVHRKGKSYATVQLDGFLRIWSCLQSTSHGLLEFSSEFTPS